MYNGYLNIELLIKMKFIINNKNSIIFVIFNNYFICTGVLDNTNTSIKFNIIHKTQFNLSI